jgi:hypothetical protein
MGLLGGIARTAVVAGTATAVSNRVSRRQANRWARNDQSAYAEQPPPQYQEQYQQPPPAVAPAPPPQDMTAQLTQLAKLHDTGVLTDAEFASAKGKILGT